MMLVILISLKTMELSQIGLVTVRKRSLGQGKVFTLVCHSVQGVWGGVSVRGVSVRETPHTVKSGRYESYWNALLLSMRKQYR